MDQVKNPKRIKIERNAMNEKRDWLNIHKNELLSRINSSSLVDLELESRAIKHKLTVNSIDSANDSGD